jgi:NTP pyrophosphatase (non-canonical NTP hydrolase)
MNNLTRPIMGIENRTPLEVFDIMVDRIKHAQAPATPLTFQELRTANAARQLEWDEDNQLTLAYRGNEFAGEAGEVCNVIKKLERERMGIRGSRDTVEHLAEELADAVMTADLIANQAGIDLSAAIVKKFNATSAQHGLATKMVECLKP